MMKFKQLLTTLSALIIFITASFAQETTSSINGIINDDKGNIVTGATITVIHEPTGAITSTQTNKKGIFNITNLKPGGPYTVKVSYVGFKEEKVDNLNFTLGNNPDINIGLKINTQALSEVVVTTTKKSSGSGVNVSRTQLNTLPSLGRSLSDFTRLTPQSNNNSF